MGVRPQSIDATIDSDDDEDNIIEYGVNEIIINYSSIEQTSKIIEQKLLNGYSQDAIWIYISNDVFDDKIIDSIWNYYRNLYFDINFLINPL
jgi:hypothetical protein